MCGNGRSGPCRLLDWRNAITIYFGGRFIDFEGLATLLVGGEINHCFGAYGELVLALTTLALGFWFLRFLYQRKIFLRL